MCYFIIQQLATVNKWKIFHIISFEDYQQQFSKIQQCLEADEEILLTLSCMSLTDQMF